MELFTFSLPRRVAEGCPNPNTHKVYLNLEEKIKEAIEQNGGKLPITMAPGSTLTERTTINPVDIVGYVVGVESDHVQCELLAGDTDLKVNSKLDGAAVQFCYLADDKTQLVNRVIKAALS